MLASNMDRGVQDYQLEAAIGKVVASVILLTIILEAEIFKKLKNFAYYSIFIGIMSR